MPETGVLSSWEMFWVSWRRICAFSSRELREMRLSILRENHSRTPTRTMASEITNQKKKASSRSVLESSTSKWR